MSEETRNRIHLYCEEQEKIKRQKEEVKRNKDLISRGLYKVLYSTEYKPGYTLENNKYFKKVPLQVTEEEYERIKQYPNAFLEKSSVKTVLNYIVIAFVLIGFILGFMVLKTNVYIGFFIWINAFLLGILYFMLFRVINIVEQLMSKKNNEDNKNT